MNLRLLTKLPLVALSITERPSIKCKKLPHFSFKDNSNPQNWFIQQLDDGLSASENKENKFAAFPLFGSTPFYDLLFVADPDPVGSGSNQLSESGSGSDQIKS